MIEQANEYSTLREELLQAKRYVFERPLVIVALGVGGISAIEHEYSGAVAFILANLVLFNFWFTVNRLMSAARIVAYIQLVLETKDTERWIGWESSLRYYRKWQKLESDRINEIVNKEIDNAAIPDAMLHYPPIYYLHIALILICVSLNIAMIFLIPSVINFISFAGSVGLSIIFYRDCRKYRPRLISSLLERNRIIWQHVFAYEKELKLHEMSQDKSNYA